MKTLLKETENVSSQKESQWESMHAEDGLHFFFSFFWGGGLVVEENKSLCNSMLSVRMHISDATPPPNQKEKHKERAQGEASSYFFLLGDVIVVQMA